MSEQIDAVDFAVAAYREQGRWSVQEITHHHLDDVETLAEALRRLPGEGGALGMVAVDEDWFLLLRVAGTSVRLLLSDVTAADDWDLADSALEHLGLPDLGDDDEQVPAGDLGLLADLGMHELDLGVLLDDVDLYPDEILSDVARRLGFGELFDDVVGMVDV
ncbi:tRNA adenosine deaminase-associated protein [Nocardioides sp. Leaf307]|uniref:tRNA adenosine deaminase-associated protein n=1 Tax=Nocardioides sp. Leaf307 TaxID=1736331 RepID=UPI0007030854|nr:tRNA adenosine deaminase-associated protein [Nocardioides sp. Leaf307]KQQ42618.1 hypothetical protein ASF50_00715 [Nocardioides sp. Leaf307]